MFILLRDIWKPFTKARELEWKELNEKLKKASSGLGVSVAERQEIMKALNLGKGHWYTCPNGHVYAIGECGGAMQACSFYKEKSCDFKLILSR